MTEEQQPSFGEVEWERRRQLLEAQRLQVLCALGWCDHDPQCDDRGDKAYKAVAVARYQWADRDEDVAHSAWLNVRPRLERTFSKKAQPLRAESLEAYAWRALRRAVLDELRKRNRIHHSEVTWTEDDVVVPDDPEQGSNVVEACRMELTRRLYDQHPLLCDRHSSGCPHRTRIFSQAFGRIAVETELVAEGATNFANVTTGERGRIVLSLSSPSSFRRTGGRYTVQQRQAMSRLSRCCEALLHSVAHTVEGDV